MPNRGHEQMFSVVMSNFIDALGIKAIETGIILSIVGNKKTFRDHPFKRGEGSKIVKNLPTS